MVTSPQGGHDMLSRSDAVMERVPTHAEMRRLIGRNLFDVEHDEWLPMRRALQPVFTKNTRRLESDCPTTRLATS
jgi:cytochrome P450